MPSKSSLVAILLSPALALAAPVQPVAATAGMTPDAAARVPDAKKLELADQSLKNIRQNVDRVAGHSERARAERDVGKLDCLDAQLTQMRGLQKVATQAGESLSAAIGRKDPAVANTEFARVLIATDKVQRMGGEADGCMGQLAFLSDGNTQVKVDQPAGLPGQDLTIRAPPAPALVTPPVVRAPAASPE